MGGLYTPYRAFDFVISPPLAPQGLTGQPRDIGWWLDGKGCDDATHKKIRLRRGERKKGWEMVSF